MSITLPRCDAQDEELRPCIRYLTHDGLHHFAGDSRPKRPGAVAAVLAYAAVLFGPAVLLVLALR